MIVKAFLYFDLVAEGHSYRVVAYGSLFEERPRVSFSVLTTANVNISS